MIYRVVTRCTVDRTYLFDVENESEAIRALGGALPQLEQTFDEEIVLVRCDEEPPCSAQKP